MSNLECSTGTIANKGGQYLEVRLPEKITKKILQETIEKISKQDSGRRIYINFARTEKIQCPVYFNRVMYNLLAKKPETYFMNCQKILDPKWQEIKSIISTLTSPGLKITPCGIISMEDLPNEKQKNEITKLKKLIGQKPIKTAYKCKKPCQHRRSCDGSYNNHRKNMNYQKETIFVPN